MITRSRRLPFSDRFVSKQGKRLLKSCANSICNIVNATEDDIMKIPGFGKRKAKHIVEILK